MRRISAAGRRAECRAYQFWDGFDHYNSSSELWDSVGGSVSYSSLYSRFAAPTGLLGQGMKCAGTGGYKIKSLLSNQATVIFGFAFYLASAPSTGGYGGGGLMNFYQGGTIQASLWITSSLELQLYRGYFTSSILLATSAPGVLTVGSWHWLDLEITISTTGGAINAYLDQPAGGTAFLSASGFNSANTGNDWMDQFWLGDINSQFGGLLVDDFHCNDTTGGVLNTVLGDSRIYTKKPNAAGYQTLWAPNGASANYQCVDDSVPDDDSTYVASNTAGQIDGYDVPPAGFSAAPNGLVRRSYIRKDDASSHTFQNGIRSGSANALGIAVAVPSSYGWTDGGTAYVDDPATSSPFTAAAADAVELIIDETS